MHAIRRELDSLVLEAMCGEPGPWTREQIRREFSGQIAAVDALTHLVTRGLVAKLEGDFFAATASGRCARRVEREGE